MATKSSRSDKGRTQSNAKTAGGSAHRPSHAATYVGTVRPGLRWRLDDEYDLYDDLSPGIDLIYGRNAGAGPARPVARYIHIWWPPGRPA